MKKFKRKFNYKFNRKFNRKKIKGGLISTTGVIFVLVAVILLNMICTTLTDRYDLTLDLTADKMFEITEDSQTMLRGMEKQVEITVLMAEDDFRTDTYYSNVYTMLHKYKLLAGDQLEISYIDPYTNPNVVEKYSDVAATIQEGSMILTCGDKTRVLNASDFYEMDSSYGSYSITGFQGEQALTSAIMAVTNEETPAVYILNGHSESVSSDFTSMLTNAGFTVDVLNLIESDIPDDAAVIVLSLPQADYSEEEVNQLDAFVKAGGDLMVFDGTASPTEMPVLYSYLQEWGIDIQADMVLDAEYNISDAPYILAQYTDSDYNLALDSKSDMVLAAPNAKSIQIISTDDDRTTEALMESLDTSYAKILTDETQYDSYDKSDEDTDGPFSLAVLANYSGNDNGGQVFVCTSALMMSNDLMEATSLLNYSFLSNVVAQLQPDIDVVSIPAKSMSAEPLVIGTTASFIVFLILLLIPVCLFIRAAVVFFRRRHL